MIDPHAVFFGRERITIAATARIDAFSLLSAGPEGIEIGEYVHISAGAKIFGGGGKVILEDFSNVSVDALLLTASDAFSGEWMIGSCLPDEYRCVFKGPITLSRHAAVGAKAVILPGVFIGWGATVGAMSLVKHPVPECAVVSGIPAQVIGSRNRYGIEKAEGEFRKRLAEYGNEPTT